MDWMQEFKDGKIAVFTNNIDEAKMFFEHCDMENIFWVTGERAMGMKDSYYEQFNTRRGIGCCSSYREGMLQGTEKEWNMSNHRHLARYNYTDLVRNQIYTIERPV